MTQLARSWPLVLISLMLVSVTAAHAADDTAPVTKLEQCIARLDVTSEPRISGQVKAPPGLSRRQLGRVEQLLSGKRATAYFYSGYDGNAAFCGLAIYGKVPGSIRKQIMALPGRIKRPLEPRDPRFYQLGSRTDAKTLYWGDPRAGGLRGLLVLERPQSANNPSLEADYHLMFLR